MGRRWHRSVREENEFYECKSAAKSKKVMVMLNSSDYSMHSSRIRKAVGGAYKPCGGAGYL
jgi:hypothetical protein